jgi:hypothetical protein
MVRNTIILNIIVSTLTTKMNNLNERYCQSSLQNMIQFFIVYTVPILNKVTCKLKRWDHFISFR